MTPGKTGFYYLLKLGAAVLNGREDKTPDQRVAKPSPGSDSHPARGHAGERLPTWAEEPLQRV